MFLQEKNISEGTVELLMMSTSNKNLFTVSITADRSTGRDWIYHLINIFKLWRYYDACKKVMKYTVFF